ncbi:MAG: N-6 DNA methylase [Candidatus Eremiobacteraeota bacterium]|nr:N-6 DNA methylase [Candidatus Eremiobacteraeota bacterium]
MSKRKQLGQFFTPEAVAKTLVRWAVRRDEDRVLDPACGDGEFLSAHECAVGIELDAVHAAAARGRAPAALVHEADFFAWAAQTHERFEAIVGNPPFIRYQGFSGAMRARALKQSAAFGAVLPQVTSSWAPFIAASSLLLKPGGRLAFVVPAEIGHASYAAPLLEALCAKFERVAVVAVREKLFAALSADAWLLYASGYGGRTGEVELSLHDAFAPSREPPAPQHRIPLAALRRSRGRLRRWLLPGDVREVYEHFEGSEAVHRLGSLATVGIGYVSGANGFFHVRPSEARRMRIPGCFLRVAVRRGGSLPAAPSVTHRHVKSWLDADEPVLLLRIARDERRLPSAVRSYLDSPLGERARQAYKCRAREPWYAVPDVLVPDGFLTYMSGERVRIVRNAARCVATNSVHVVRMKGTASFRALQQGFESALSRLSCEVEGHPLGGGMLKVEPREAQRILVPGPAADAELRAAREVLERGSGELRRWRGYA